MKIIGHKWIKSDLFYTIDAGEKFDESSLREQVSATPPGSVLLFGKLDEASRLAIAYCRSNLLPCALEAADIKTVILGYNLGAGYIIADKTILKQTQELAREYLFDTLILARISDEEEIAGYAVMGIDGVIFEEAIR